MVDRPRTFQELVAAINPAEHERIERRAVEQDFHANVWFLPDRHERGAWRVEYQDDDGACYVTIFAGPEADRRAQDYFEALQTGRLKTIRYASSLEQGQPKRAPP